MSPAARFTLEVMLHGIEIQAAPKTSENAVDLLLACHQRIRHFTSMLRKLAHAEAASPEEISRAADAIYRYFSVALPLHEADEEESVRPRLKTASQAKVAGALEAMTHQHQAVDDLVERVMPILVLLSNNPAKLPEAHADLCSLAGALEEVFKGHLALEEEILFPALRNDLPPEALAGVLDEMQRRRKQGS